MRRLENHQKTMAFASIWPESLHGRHRGTRWSRTAPHRTPPASGAQSSSSPIVEAATCSVLVPSMRGARGKTDATDAKRCERRSARGRYVDADYVDLVGFRGFLFLKSKFKKQRNIISISRIRLAEDHSIAVPCCSQVFGLIASQHEGNERRKREPPPALPPPMPGCVH